MGIYEGVRFFSRRTSMEMGWFDLAISSCRTELTTVVVGGSSQPPQEQKISGNSSCTRYARLSLPRPAAPPLVSGKRLKHPNTRLNVVILARAHRRFLGNTRYAVSTRPLSLCFQLVHHREQSTPPLPVYGDVLPIGVSQHHPTRESKTVRECV